jgi:hypothetical protein
MPHDDTRRFPFQLFEPARAPEDGGPGGGSGGGSAGEPEGEGLCLDPYETLGHAAAKSPRMMSWPRAGIADPAQWQEEARVKLAEVSGYGRFGGPPQMLHRKDLGVIDGFRHESFCIRARHAYDVPVRLVYRDTVPRPRRPVICLQGGGIGMAASWGQAAESAETKAVEAGFDFARQAAANGHLAVCIELMGAGIRRPTGPGDGAGSTLGGIATHGMLVGHSLLGQHASDISMTVNWLAGREVGFEVDAEKIAVIGHDLGAAAGLLAAALDTRLWATVMVDPPLRFRDAVKRRAVTPEMTMPGLLRWMDIDDILLLCAPRPVLACPGIARGESDFTDLIEGSRLFFGLLDAESSLFATDSVAGIWPLLDRIAADG